MARALDHTQRTLTAQQHFERMMVRTLRRLRFSILGAASLLCIACYLHALH